MGLDGWGRRRWKLNPLVGQLLIESPLEARHCPSAADWVQVLACHLPAVFLGEVTWHLSTFISFLWNEDTNPRGTGIPYRVISCLHIFSSLFKGKWQGCPIELKLTIWLAFISEMCAEVVSALTGKNLQKPQSPCFCHNNSHWWCLCHSRIGKTWCPPPPILDGCLILVEAFVVESH